LTLLVKELFLGESVTVGQSDFERESIVWPVTFLSADVNPKISGRRTWAKRNLDASDVELTVYNLGHLHEAQVVLYVLSGGAHAMSAAPEDLSCTSIVCKATDTFGGSSTGFSYPSARLNIVDRSHMQNIVYAEIYAPCKNVYTSLLKPVYTTLPRPV
jgi:hypothetical protein